MTLRPLAITFVLLAAGGASGSDNTDPVVASGHGIGSAWYALVVPEGATCVRIASTHEFAQGFKARAFVTYTEDDAIIAAHVVAVRDGEAKVVASSGSMELTIEPVPPDDYSTDGEVAVLGCNGAPRPSTTKLLVIEAGTRGNWTFTATSPDNVSFNYTYGSSAWGFEAPDFDGVFVGAAWALPMVAHANVASEVSLEIANTLIASFSGELTTVGLQRMEGPTGGADCPCLFAEYGAGSLGAGTYRFTTTEAGGPLGNSVLVAADVVLPTAP